jgi:hypothetical protein
MTYCRKKPPFCIAFQLRFKEIFARGKAVRVISYRDSRLSGRSANRLLLNNPIVTQSHRESELVHVSECVLFLGITGFVMTE